jgi:RNA polymerase sigma factor (sigma-70 family)
MDRASKKSPATVWHSERLVELYRRQLSSAKRLAYLLLGEEGAAEDLVQDAFVRVFNRFGDLRGHDAFNAYLRTTIINLSRDALRRRRLERNHAKRERTYSVLAESLPDVGTRDEVWEALRQLPHRQRVALVLRYYQDLS